MVVIRKTNKEASALMIMIMALAGIFLMAFGAAYLVFFAVKSSDLKNNGIKARYAAESCLQEFKYSLSNKYVIANSTTTDVAALCLAGESNEVMSNDILGGNTSCAVSCDDTSSTGKLIITGRSGSATYRMEKPYLSDLLASWRFNEHDLSNYPLVFDASGHSNDANITGVSTALDDPNPAFVYSGLFSGTSYADMGSLSLADPANWTVSFWAKPNSGGSNIQTIIYDLNGYATNTIAIESDYLLRVNLNISGADYSYSFNHLTNTLPSWYGVWHQYTVSYDGEVLRAYIDGVAFEDTYTISGSIASGGGNMIIGLNQDTGDALNGNLDELRIYNRAVSADEAKILHDYLLLY